MRDKDRLREIEEENRTHEINRRLMENPDAEEITIFSMFFNTVEKIDEVVQKLFRKGEQ